MAKYEQEKADFLQLALSMKRQRDGHGNNDECRQRNPKVKILMGLKCLAYGVSPSAFQDYFQMGETTGRMCMKRLARVLASSDELTSVFLRSMSRADAKRITQLHLEKHGVDGMIGSLDCMHIGWKNCPVAWQGQFSGAKGKPTIVLEAFADYNLWIWHASFGSPGTLNDINIWDRSPLLESFINGSFDNDVDFEFTIGGTVFRRLWLLTDGIYPELARFVKTIDEPGHGIAGKYAAVSRKPSDVEIASFKRGSLPVLKKGTRIYSKLTY